MKKLKAHVFICTNERDPGHPRGCCQSKGSDELVKAFKAELVHQGLGLEVRAQRAGCLDTCEGGPSVVIYPEGIWYGKVQLQDIPEIVQTLREGGKPVQRLKIPGK